MLDYKTKQRRKGYQARDLQVGREILSRIICDRFMALDAYREAETVMVYVSYRTEVETQSVVTRLLASSKHLVIPYCTKDRAGRNQLGLWHLADLSELYPGTWGIPEPPKSRWGELGKEISPRQPDLIMVPGVAFDRYGGRLGNGAGYYDRLLASVRPDAVLCGVCFESQLLEKIVMDLHDIAMDMVVTEKGVYDGEKQADSGVTLPR